MYLRDEWNDCAAFICWKNKTNSELKTGGFGTYQKLKFLATRHKYTGSFHAVYKEIGYVINQTYCYKSILEI
jgi:hypothetical protein